MAVVSNFAKWIIGDDEEDDFIEENEMEEKPSNAVKFKSDFKTSVVFSNPSDFSGAREIADAIDEQKIVITNMRACTHATIQRIVDFISGVSYANHASIRMIAENVWVIIPMDVNTFVTNNTEEKF